MKYFSDLISLQNTFLYGNFSLLAANFGSWYVISKFICCSILRLNLKKLWKKKLWEMLVSSTTQIQVAKLKIRGSCELPLLSKCHILVYYASTSGRRDVGKVLHGEC